MLKLKKILKKVALYFAAFAAGIVIYVLVTPYAKAHRNDPTLVGGECLIPIICVAAVALVDGRQSIKDMFAEVEDDERDQH